YPPAPAVSYYTPSVTYYAPAVPYYTPSVSYYAPPTAYYPPPVAYYPAPAAVTTTRYGLFGRPRVRPPTTRPSTSGASGDAQRRQVVPAEFGLCVPLRPKLPTADRLLQVQLAASVGQSQGPGARLYHAEVAAEAVKDWPSARSRAARARRRSFAWTSLTLLF